MALAKNVVNRASRSRVPEKGVNVSIDAEGTVMGFLSFERTYP